MKIVIEIEGNEKGLTIDSPRIEKRENEDAVAVMFGEALLLRINKAILKFHEDTKKYLELIEKYIKEEDEDEQEETE